MTRRIGRASFVLGCIALCSSAQAALVRIDVTYTNGRVVSGPLTPDLGGALPESVNAWFIVDGAGSFATADVRDSFLSFGDGTWDANDLEEFGATVLPDDAGTLIVTSLSYSYAAKNTPTTNGRLSANFPLQITGMDIASGELFDYMYDDSTQTVTEVPEPASWWAVVTAAPLSLALRRRRAAR